MSRAGGAGLRVARLARGYSQQQLAEMAGVSRQAVSALEAGQSDPSLRVALALAQALGLTVDELFGTEHVTTALPARLVVGPERVSSRVTLAPIGDSLVALPLAGSMASRAGFLPAGGLVTGPAPERRRQSDGLAWRPLDAAGKAPAGRPHDATPDVAVRPLGPPRPTLVVAGCDPALPLLEQPLSLLDPPIAFRWWPCSSQEALRLASAGLVHAAGAHLRDESGDYNTSAAAELLPGGAEVVGFSAWREGLVIAQTAAYEVTGLGDVVSHGLRLVNREPGAEARRVLDRELAELGIDGSSVPGYGTAAAGHLQVADAIAAGLADAGVASEPAALVYGLAFLPLTTERFDLVIPAAEATSREVQGLLKVLSARWLLDQLAAIPGYDPASCGQHVATLPPSGL